MGYVNRKCYDIPQGQQIWVTINLVTIILVTIILVTNFANFYSIWEHSNGEPTLHTLVTYHNIKFLITRGRDLCTVSDI